MPLPLYTSDEPAKRTYKYKRKRKQTATARGLTGYQTAAAPKRRKNRFGATEKVSSAVENRTIQRAGRLGALPVGVEGSDGYTGREARLIKRALKRKKTRAAFNKKSASI